MSIKKVSRVRPALCFFALMRRCVFLIVVNVFFGVPWAQASSLAVPATSEPNLASSAAVASEGSSDLSSEFMALQARLSEYVSQGHVAGISFGVWQGKARLFLGVDGVASFDSHTPIDDNTIFRIYSMTKPVTSVAMMILHERGVWAFDDPIEMHIPKFTRLKILSRYQDGVPVLIDPEQRPTMGQLMAHTAGFAYGLSRLGPVEEYYQEKRILESQSHAALIDKLAIAPLAYEPGSSWQYSISSDIQGALIEQWTGLSLGAFMQAEIFDPLGMTDTAFSVPEPKRERFSDIFTFPRGSKKLATLANWTERFTDGTVKRHKGGGGLVSTQADFANFLLMLRNKGKVGDRQILDPLSAEKIMAPHLPNSVGMWAETDVSRVAQKGHSFGLGVGIITDPAAADLPFGAGTIYWSGIAGTWFWFDPENDVFAIGMMQRYNSPYVEQIDFAKELAALTYDALDAAKLTRQERG